MIIIKIIIFITLFALFAFVLMSIIEGRIRRRQNQKILWRMEQIEKKENQDE
tara:strand:- start:446 stop:601 length:156 start_codon:yes stop_codon:yes gene_type:complete